MYSVQVLNNLSESPSTHTSLETVPHSLRISENKQTVSLLIGVWMITSVVFASNSISMDRSLSQPLSTSGVDEIFVQFSECCLLMFFSSVHDRPTLPFLPLLFWLFWDFVVECPSFLVYRVMLQCCNFYWILLIFDYNDSLIPLWNSALEKQNNVRDLVPL